HPLPAYGKDDLWGALIGGEPTLYVRYRFSLVDDDSAEKTGLSNSVRTALGYRTGLFHDLGAYFELEDVRQLGSQKFYDGLNDKKGLYPTIMDPQGTEINQAYFSYQGLEGTVFKAGRQLILYRPGALNRFIGNVVWRQHWQTYDAFSIVNKSLLPNTTLSYAFVWNTNRVYGNDNPMLGDTPMLSHFINV